MTGEILPAFYDDVAVVSVQLHAVAGAVKLLTGDERRARAAEGFDQDIVLVRKRHDIFRWQRHWKGGGMLGSNLAFFTELLRNRLKAGLLRSSAAFHL